MAHSAEGSAFTMENVQGKRPPIYDFGGAMELLQVPALVIIGDDDTACLKPAIFMKEHIPGAGLAVLPQAGHGINLEEPDLFNRYILDFLTAVEAGAWVGATG
jgi:pimeloyl-ACP methyl ester carboxylesterase